MKEEELYIPGTHPDRNFPQDYDQENGKYINKCIYCGLLFIGNKHRVVCRQCEGDDIVNAITPEKP